ncbi:unnamed protein product [Peronospora belbahrii]|uniref:F-box domain-containing protein n=1 Tax=Peronospora belbahrii TaxID=622444 RepID=A0ABN8CNG5_9STRA|nr:unnamed protein product [Peronospora belbahrii]
MIMQRTSGIVRRLMEQEEVQCAFNRHVIIEVQSVLNEMVYDVESCAHECELVKLKRKLDIKESSLVEYQERESKLLQERQQAYEYATKVEHEGRTIMCKLNGHLGVVVAELAKKEVMESELQQAKEQLKLASHLSKELANAQREIRELRRENDIQHILTRKNLAPSKFVSESRIPLRGSHGIVRATSGSEELSAAKRQGENIFSPLPDKVMLKLFSFLDEEGMVAISVIDRTLVQRVNFVFGITTPSNVANSAPRAPVRQPSPLRRKLSKTRSFIGSTEKDKLSKVDAIVKSLKPDQVKLFHDMSTRVKTLEVHLTQVQTEKEDIAARLYSTESVRDFLMEKLKGLEDKLADLMAITAKKDEQTALDREIIGFLDAKTQEYETTLKEYAQQNNALRMNIAQFQEEQGSKTTIIQDMVELLTEEKQELEAQVRSQRKVLVREVKVLRAQNQQLTAERDQYFTQLQQLKHALQHLDELH